jgi:choline dehydrogenase-like flavoprotein
MDLFEHVIVGSGPAGVAAARQLERSKTCMVDVGQEPTSVLSQTSLANTLSSGDGSLLGTKWEMLANLVDSMRFHPKLRASAVRHVMQGEPYDVAGAAGQLLVRGRGSFAAGGMANVWGAQLLRYNSKDLLYAGDWPIDANDLEPYYADLEAHIGISGAIDDMHTFLGDAYNLQPPVPMVSAACHLMKRYSATTKSTGLYPLLLGRPRLAVLTQPHLGRPAHDFGETEFFKPVGAGIYSPLHTLNELRERGNIQYLGGHKLLSYSEQKDFVELELEVVKTQERKRIRSKQLLLGCGTVQTSRLVLMNCNQSGRKLPFVDHPPTLLPIFFPAVFGAPLPSLSYSIQLIGTIQGIDNRDMMTFYYPGGILWSDLLPDIPLPLNSARSVLAALIGGMLVAQIWEASKPTPGNQLSVDKNGKVTIHYSERQSYSNLPVLLASLRKLGGYSLKRLATAPPPSWGFHHAATLPMRANPQEFQTHIDGRLWNSQRVRVIDGSVLPSLPAKNHSLTIMANASRIAKLAKSCEY